MSLTTSPVCELLDLLRSGRVSSVELTGAYLERIERYDASIGAFLSVRHDAALKEAREIDDRRARGQSLACLAGLPVAVKDILCCRGEPTTCGSRMLESFRPPYDATVVARLKEAGAVILGKNNLDEFAMGGSTENSALAVTRNPWDTLRIPGGSSGGSAACVAADFAPLSVGTDTGGSIRQPSALCGITGMKPTYGRVSRYGLVAFASSLDQAGPIGHSARDIAQLLEVIAGHDPCDSTSVERPVPCYTETIDRPLAGLRLGVVREQFASGLDGEIADTVQEAIGVYESLGAVVRDVSLPHSKYAVATYYVIAPCEASGNLARYDGAHYGYRTNELKMRAQSKTESQLQAKGNDAASRATVDNPLVRMYRQSRAEGFGPEVKRRIMLGTYALSAGYYDAYYLKALKVRRLIRGDFDDAFREVDVLAGPVTPTPAFKLGEKRDDPLAMYLVDLFTVGANLAGIPGISIPCGFSSGGLPIGLQLQAPPFEEERLLRAAHMFQQATDWHQKRPSLA